MQPQVICSCGLKLKDFSCIEETDLAGWIWQAACTCGRSWTVEVASDPSHPMYET